MDKYIPSRELIWKCLKFLLMPFLGHDIQGGKILTALKHERTQPAIVERLPAFFERIHIIRSYHV